ncbi:TRAP transporter, substrate binding protein, DctP family [Campylobacter blaseri]|uniref:C4-dicarboxylate ABC transporter n=1 Tax=Campylobacter blaseri TaxID=2042961 RepID=A0A2P8R142_9BACT|nr:DctP family TRAP transporter solute-binding subunit [Campylobacter blaseri]PSM52201.1 C4-dicarboxylate ABC transporter [Campylobacter blaseri]PSM53967.1 C4-dicarboxylate ABC transporter [Campylobacter blaseri]QKF85405.1 TRAP transporter, substrate binding protein, DctP family [Campylobacter blaseri]
MSKTTKVLTGLLFLVSSVFAADYSIKFSHVVSADTPKGKAANYFAKRVEELTDGKIEVHIFPNSQLYTDAAVMKALKMNNVQMAVPSFSKFTRIVPQMQLFDLPFLFRDTEHLHKVIDGEVGQILKDMVNKKGFIALDFWDNGFKQFSSSKKGIIKPDDLIGQKVRIMSSKVLEEQMKILGATPQVLPFSEVYSALQQGVVDGAENPLANFYTEKFYEAQSDLTMSNHGYLGYLVIVSEKFWKKLPKDLQEKVTQAMKEATAKEREMAKEMEDEFMAKIQDYAQKTQKIKIHTLSKEQRDEFKKKTETIYPEFYDSIGENLIKKTLNQ